MRTFYLFAIILLAATVSKAQLKNTKWTGTMNVPDATTVILDFKADSVDMVVADAGFVGETMTYSVKDSIITMKKTSGHSPCNIGGEFKVKYIIKDDKLFITNLSDNCDERVQSWNKEPFIRVKQ